MKQLSIKQTSFEKYKENIDQCLNKLFNNDFVLLVTKPNDDNLIVMSEKQFNEQQRTINNLNYLLNLTQSQSLPDDVMI